MASRRWSMDTICTCGCSTPRLSVVPEGDEVERLRALGYESGSSLLETVARAISKPAERDQSLWADRPGRWRFRDKRAKARVGDEPSSSRQGLARTGLGRSHRGASCRRSTARHAAGAKAQRALSAPRGPVPAGTPSVEGERVQVEAQHELHVVSIGKRAEAISPPSEWIDPPMRPRPALDKQELLSGLTGGHSAGRP